MGDAARRGPPQPWHTETVVHSREVGTFKALRGDPLGYAVATRDLPALLRALMDDLTSPGQVWFRLCGAYLCS